MKSGWQISHWWGLWGPNRMDKWATDHQDQGNPVSAREWAALLRALQQLGWSALDQCRSVWKVCCRLRAGIDADVAAKAKTVATRARQQRWRDSQSESESKRAAKREKAAADKEQAHRLGARSKPPDQIDLRGGRPASLTVQSSTGGQCAISSPYWVVTPSVSQRWPTSRRTPPD